MNLIQRTILLIIFLMVLGAIIGFARGYRLDLEKKSLTSTGILSVSSTPKAAKVYLDGALKGATDLNLTLPPGNYKVEIKKDGYTSWSKKINLKGELVLTLDATLFPSNPTLSPLTNLGILKAIPVDQTDKIILISQTGDDTKDGIYLFEAGRKPLSFLTPLTLLISKKNLPANLDLNDVSAIFSPDFKQGVFTFKKLKTITSLLLSLEEENKSPFDVTYSVDTLTAAWDKKRQEDSLKILESYPKEIAKIASDSFHILAFSPDETKVLYQSQISVNLPISITPPLIATDQTPEVRSLRKDHYYVYDKKEDKNFEIFVPVSSLELPVEWYPDSRHLIIDRDKRIAVIDYDGINEQTIYSGPFENSFFSITSDGALIVLANLNPESNKWPDLYNAGIK